MLETRYGVRGTVCDGVFFTESEIPGSSTVRRVEVEISRQNANLMEVKKRMAAEAKHSGSYAITSFKYGQRSHPWWQLAWLKWDTESWFGTGDAVRVSRQ